MTYASIWFSDWFFLMVLLQESSYSLCLIHDSPCGIIIKLYLLCLDLYLATQPSWSILKLIFPVYGCLCRVVSLGWERCLLVMSKISSLNDSDKHLTTLSADNNSHIDLSFGDCTIIKHKEDIPRAGLGILVPYHEVQHYLFFLKTTAFL